MDKRYNHSEVEPQISSFWNTNKLYEAEIDPSKEPFCIILPPPNANADLHAGHAMFVYEDIMIRYNRLIGKNSFWVAGFDHAGIETQFVYEKHLKKQGKSRFNYDPDTLREMIREFVDDNKPRMRTQLQRLGFALDWSKEQFTMDESIIRIVYKTFQKLFDDGLVYRGVRLVNYSVPLGTSFSDYEVVYEERNDPLYYIKYGPFELATVRPETKFGDTAVAVHPDDKRYNKWIGKEIEVEGVIGPFTIRVIGDEAVDPDFGTGVVKVTPAHDFNDFEMAQRHNVPLKQVIGFDGRMNEHAGPYQGLKVMAARERIVEDMKKKGLISRVDEKYVHRVALCYKSKSVIEPLPLEQWFIKVAPLIEKARQYVEEEKITFFPDKYKQRTLDLYDIFYDWNISRQVVWGIPIPAFYDTKEERWIVESDPETIQSLKNDPRYQQDTDTFDTWFSSGQWPYATLQNISEEFFNYFYPTAVMETGFDILRPWVARMIMLGLYQTGKPPFRHVFLHGLVRDKHGQKMSKSKGNVINPMELVEKYGADALRAALIFGTQDGNDMSLSDDKVRAMRNFTNKVWNIGRFLNSNDPDIAQKDHKQQGNESDSEYDADAVKKTLDTLKTERNELQSIYHSEMEKDHFSKGLDHVYHFLWHRLADHYIEELKQPLWAGDTEVFTELKQTYLLCLGMLHPYMPFVTEKIWSIFHNDDTSILQTEIIKK